MKRLIAMAAGMLGCIVVINSSASEVALLCGSREAVIKTLARVGEKKVFQGIMTGGKSMVFGFASAKKNTWTIVIAAEGGPGDCIAATGTDFETERLISDPT